MEKLGIVNRHWMTLHWPSSSKLGGLFESKWTVSKWSHFSHFRPFFKNPKSAHSRYFTDGYREFRDTVWPIDCPQKLAQNRTVLNVIGSKSISKQDRNIPFSILFCCLGAASSLKQTWTFWTVVLFSLDDKKAKAFWISFPSNMNFSPAGYVKFTDRTWKWTFLWLKLELGNLP